MIAMKEAMLKIAITLSMLSIAFGIEPSSATLSDADLLFFEIDAVNPLPSKIDPTTDFNSLISSESAKNILLASSEVSFQSESSQVKWLENKQKEAINGDPHPVFVCDMDTSRTGGQRKALLLGHGYQASSVVTLYNSEEKSCYIVHSRDEEIDRLTSLTDTYSVVPLSYAWKMRSNTVETIFNNERTSPLKVSTLVFQQNKVQMHSATTKSTPSYANKVLKFAKDEVLNEHLFFAANNQPGTKSMDFFGYDNAYSTGEYDSLPPNTDDITSICKDSYNYIKFSYEYFMGEKDLMTMIMDTEDMEKFITETYISSMSIPSDELFKNCVLSLVISMSLLPEVTSIEAKAQIRLFNDQLQYMVQTFTEKKTPWYDAGLTGKGEIVALSDSGIDANNCYFWDSQGPVPYGQYVSLA